MYRRTWASSNPTVLTQYPRAQKLRPNNVPLVCNNSRWIRIALLPFRYPIVIAMLDRGGTLCSRWMWSGLALPSTSSIAFWRHNSRRMCPMPRRILPYNTLRRYFGRITTWYLQSHLTWAWLCQSFMAVLPPLEAFLGEDRLTSTSGTAEPIGFAPPEAVDSLLIEPAGPSVIPSGHGLATMPGGMLGGSAFFKSLPPSSRFNGVLPGRSNSMRNGPSSLRRRSRA